MRPGLPIVDVCIPFYGSRDLLEQVMFSFAENRTEVPYRVIICDDGNQAEVMEWIRAVAQSMPDMPLIAVRHEKPLGVARSIERCLEHSNTEWTAVINPGFLIDDKNWFGKMVAPLQRDPTGLMVYVDTTLPPNTEPPVRLKPKVVNTKPLPQTGLVLLRRKPMRKMGIKFGAALWDGFARDVVKLGASVWCALSVRMSPASFVPRTQEPVSAEERKRREASRPQLVISR